MEPVEEVGVRHKALDGTVVVALETGMRGEYQEIWTLVFNRWLGAFRRTLTGESPASKPNL